MAMGGDDRGSALIQKKDDIIKLNKKNKTKTNAPKLQRANKKTKARGGGVAKYRQQRGGRRANQRQLVAQQAITVAQQRRAKRVQNQQKTARANLVAQKRQLAQTMRGQDRSQRGQGQTPRGQGQSQRGQGRPQSARGQGRLQRARGRGRAQSARGRLQTTQVQGQSPRGRGGRRPLKRNYGTMHSDLMEDGLTSVQRGWSGGHTVQTSMTISVPAESPTKDVKIFMGKQKRGQGRIQQSQGQIQPGQGQYSNGSGQQLQSPRRGRGRGQNRGRGRGQNRGRGRGREQQGGLPLELQATSVSESNLPPLNIKLGKLPSSSMSLNDRFSSMTSRSQSAGRIVYL